ncbi:tyrosine-type recombinase/integrase [Streptomyces sp. NPDC059248]|uniref:tyrosine-type recombinase/integrase n=1 Tax=Streptomyces sp. NPDC059248 TaxID=3346791 RepID=UPI0036C3358F
MDELPAAWRTMCLLGFCAGLRRGELAGLHHHRIDRRRSRLFVVEVNTKSGIKEYPKSRRPASRRRQLANSDLVARSRQHAHYFDTDGDRHSVPHYPPHAMRHTCASWLVQRGVFLCEVQHLLGHESSQATRRYARLQLDAHKIILGVWEWLETPLTLVA